MTKIKLWAIVIVLGLSCLGGLTAPYIMADDETVNADVIVISPTSPSGGGGSLGGGGDGGSGGTTLLYDYISEEGVFINDAFAESADGVVSLYIPKGTLVRRNNGQNLRSISISEYTDTSGPPSDCSFVCLSYNIGPSDTTFTPPARLTFKYDDSDVPFGVAEKNMVFATWKTGEWVELEGNEVNSNDNSITVLIDHLSIYTVMAFVSPANFEINGLSITPAEIFPNQTFTISATINNAGDLTGDFEVTLKIDDVVSQIQTLTIDGRDSMTVEFTVTSGAAGEHTININGLSGKFTVKTAKPPGTIAEVPIPEPPQETLPPPVPVDEPQPPPRTTPEVKSTATAGPTIIGKETLPVQAKDNKIRIITLGVGVFFVTAALLTLFIGRRRF